MTPRTRALGVRFLASGYGAAAEDTIALCLLRGDGQVEVQQSLGGLDDPSWTVVDPSGSVAFTVLEGVTRGLGGGSEGGVAVLGLDIRGATVREVVDSGGRQPCHLALSPSGRCLAVAHYGDGVVAVHRVDLTAGARVQPLCAYNLGAGSRAHAVTWLDDTHLLVTDIGRDRVVLLRVDAGGGRAHHVLEIEVAGGPRHLVVRGTAAFVSLENRAAMAVLAVGPGRAPRVVSEVGFPRRAQEPTAAAFASAVRLAHDGRRVYVPVRGSDVVQRFDVAAGTPRALPPLPSGGAYPYDVLSADGWLLVANQRSRTVATFSARDVDDEGTRGPVTTTYLPFAVSCLVPG